MSLYVLKKASFIYFFLAHILDEIIKKYTNEKYRDKMMIRYFKNKTTAHITYMYTYSVI